MRPPEGYLPARASSRWPGAVSPRTTRVCGGGTYTRYFHRRDERRDERVFLARGPLAAASKGADMSERTPTVVLVHGAFADASSWNGVITRLQAAGVPVTAP